MRLVQVEQCTDRVTIGGAFRLFLFGRISPVINPAAVLRGSLARIREEDVRVPAQADSPQSAMVAVVERERFVAGVTRIANPGTIVSNTS
jgi:hypothetical protein